MFLFGFVYPFISSYYAIILVIFIFIVFLMVSFSSVPDINKIIACSENGIYDSEGNCICNDGYIFNIDTN